MFSLTYVCHDCFLLSTEEANFVFDYWEAPPSAATSEDQGDSSIFPDKEMVEKFIFDTAENKPVYVVVSHHHKDHFTRYIFQWAQRSKNVRYIISKDVWKTVKSMWREGGTYRGFVPDRSLVTVLTPGESAIFHEASGEVGVHAFGSTDIGNSYIIQCSRKEIFMHAGDLNAWLWKDESTEKEISDALSQYNAILDTISAAFPKITLAMFPVDSRIGTDYWTGASLLVRKIDVGIFVPMHFELAETSDERIRRHQDARNFTAYANRERGLYVWLGESGANLFQG